MSYCRKLEGDLYIYQATSGGFECCDCLLGSKYPDHGVLFFRCKGREEMLRHMFDHVGAGHKVPDYAMHGMLDEILWGIPDDKCSLEGFLDENGIWQAKKKP